MNTIQYRALEDTRRACDESRHFAMPWLYEAVAPAKCPDSSRVCVFRCDLRQRLLELSKHDLDRFLLGDVFLHILNEGRFGNPAWV